MASVSMELHVQYMAMLDISVSFALHLIPTVEAGVEYNCTASGQPIATIKAVHTGPNAAKSPADDAGGLEAVICLAKLAHMMLTSNLRVTLNDG